MSLITRCPACGTMFKVVADQLKVAQGWVRCGHCSEIFDASLHLVPDEVVDFQESSWAPEDATSVAPPPFAPLPHELTGQRPDALDSWLASSPGASERAGASAPAAPTSAAPVASASAAPSGFSVDGGAANPPASAPESAPPKASAEPDAPATPEAPEVSFVRDAQRREFWKKPLVRGLLGLLCLGLLTALLLQWALQQKDTLAVREPRLLPLLQALCAPLHCAVHPLRHIEALVIDSSNFSKTGPDVYRLSFVLKNTGTVALEIPALEVTLTDSQDQALVRRVLTPAQFGVSAATLAAHAELASAVSLKVTGPAAPGAAPAPSAPLPVTGYRILAFYP